MAFAKRIFLFMAVNLAMVITISLVLQLLGVQPYLRQYGLDYSSLAMFCLVWGMGGAFFSLMISRIMAKMFMGVKVVDANSEFGELVRTVHNLARAARLPAMPEVGVYDSPEVNAFATGPTKSRALVAVSTGLLRTMNKNELEGVLAHEIAHIANGDMVTMTLIQGVINAFVMFLARVAAFALSSAIANRNSNDDRPASPMITYFMTMMFEMVFGLIGFLIVAWFSRWREFRADGGGASLAGRENMRAALSKLLSYSQNIEAGSPATNVLKISGRPGALFSTHPPLEERIRRLS